MSTSTAISAQGSKLYIAGTPGSSITITGITKATSAVVTGTHSLAVGDVVEFGTVAGMPEIYGLLGIVTAVSTTVSFTVNIDSSDYAAVGTDGAAVPQTWTKIGNFIDYNGFDGSASELDRTHMESDAMENFPGLQDFGQFTFNIDVDNTDTGQLALRAAKTTATILPYKLRLPNAKLRVWHGWVKKFTETGGVNKIVKAAVDVRVTGAVNFGTGV